MIDMIASIHSPRETTWLSIHIPVAAIPRTIEPPSSIGEGMDSAVSESGTFVCAPGTYDAADCGGNCASDDSGVGVSSDMNRRESRRATVAE